MALSPSNILEFNTIAKYAVMAIFFHIKRQLMLDLLADTFIKLVHRMRTKAKKYVDNNILKEIKRVEGKLDILEKIAIASVNNPKNSIEDKIYTEVSALNSLLMCSAKILQTTLVSTPLLYR